MKLQIIVPARNEAANIRYFHDRAVASLRGIEDLDWCIVFVNNASEDDSLERILELRRNDERIKVITLSRDFGYHSALTAGLSQLEADCYAMIDVDCEDPPELLPTFVAELRRGAHVAYGVRSNRDEPGHITLGRRLFYLLNFLVADSEAIMWMGEFSMMTRQVRDAILAARTTYPFVRAEMGYVGFRRVGVPYLREKRKHGSSHYNLFRMARFAVGGILSSSTFPLRFVMYLGILLAIGFPAAVMVMGLNLSAAADLAALVAFYFLLIALSFLSLYVARTYKNGIGRPVFIVNWSETHL